MQIKLHQRIRAIKFREKNILFADRFTLQGDIGEVIQVGAIRCIFKLQLAFPHSTDRKIIHFALRKPDGNHPCIS